ncbi:hypothetical protein [Aquabacterium sp.]|uniref:hypothetical protein n=1 Tax=Aquabacterium sp. TaxID=1872578 RepID=UPI0025C64AED|nr:hypothetical protein [Aquabacterium sp.]
MDINRDLPLLFGTPGRAASARALMWSFFVAGASTLCFSLTSFWPSLPYFWLMTVLIGLHGIVAVTSSGANLLYVFRYFLIWILVWGAALVWALFPNEVYVAPFGLEYQSLANTQILVLAGALALCGVSIGWTLATSGMASERPLFYLESDSRRRLQRIGGLMVIIFSALYVWKSGGFVGEGKAYADGQEGFDLEFGVFNVFHYIGVACLVLAAIQPRGFLSWPIVLAAGSLVMGILVGSRADYLPQLFILLLLLVNARISMAIRILDLPRLLYWSLGILVALGVGYLVASYLAIWRTGLDPIEAWRFMQDNDRGSIISDVYGHKMLYFETGNMMLGGFYSAIVQVEQGITGFLNGNSYFNYLLISPPSFLGLPRPEGLELKTDLFGTVMSQGGIFEVAEAYWNFGFAGAFGVPCFISFFLGRVLVRGLVFRSYFYLVMFMVLGFMGFRAIWYQNFSYFRILTIMLLLYGGASIFAVWFVAHRERLPSGGTAQPYQD